MDEQQSTSQYNKAMFLAQNVAATCDIDCERMLSKDMSTFVSQARGLFWFAYRYWTNEPYRRIREITSELGYAYTLSGIAHSINNMAKLVVDDPMWKKRWTLIKRIIKADKEESDTCKTITIQVPKGLLNDKIKIEIKEI